MLATITDTVDTAVAPGTTIVPANPDDSQKFQLNHLVLSAGAKPAVVTLYAGGTTYLGPFNVAAGDTKFIPIGHSESAVNGTQVSWNGNADLSAVVTVATGTGDWTVQANYSSVG